MAKVLGATDAFNAIAQKMDETLIQADALLRDLRVDAIGEKTESKVEDRTLIPSPIGSERSCSPNPSSCCSLSSTSLSNFSSFGSSTTQPPTTIHVKNKAFMGLDKKKAIVVTSLKSKDVISETEVAKVQKLINDLFKNKLASSSSASYMSI